MCEERRWDSAFSETQNKAISLVVDAVNNGGWFSKTCLWASYQTGIELEWIENHARKYVTGYWRGTKCITPSLI